MISWRINIWSVGLYTLIILFYAGAFLQSTLAWAPFGFFLLLLLSTAQKLKITSSDLRSMRWFLLLMGWTYASVLWSIDEGTTIASLRNLIPKLVIVIFAYKFPVTQKVLVERAGILIALIASGFALYFVVMYGAVRISAAEKAVYTISYANIISAGIVAVVPLIMFNKRGGWLTVPNAVLALSVWAVVVSESRAGIIILGGAIALSLGFANSVRMSKWFISLIVGAILMMIGYLVVQTQFPQLADRLDSIGNTISVLSLDRASEISGGVEDFKRKIQIVYTIEQIKNLPIFGVGYGAFGEAIQRSTGVYVQAHSLFGTFFVELGLIGFVLFLIFKVTLIRALLHRVNDLRHPDEAQAARMAFVAVVIVTIFFFSRPQMSEITYFIVIGLAMNAAAYRNHKHVTQRSAVQTCLR